MTKNRRIFPSAAPEPASPLTEAPRRKRKNWRSWLTIQVESERYQPPRSGILLLQVLVGIFFFREPVSGARLFFAALLLVGIVGLKLTSA